MAEVVIDGLEAIKIDENHTDESLMAIGVDQRPPQAIGEQHPIGQAGKGIVVGKILQVFFRTLTLDDPAKLRCHRRDKPNQLIIGPLRYGYEKFEYGDSLIIGEHRDSQRDSVMNDGIGHIGTRKIRGAGHVGDPDRLFRKPHAPRQIFTQSNRVADAHHPKYL